MKYFDEMIKKAPHFIFTFSNQLCPVFIELHRTCVFACSGPSHEINMNPIFVLTFTHFGTKCERRRGYFQKCEQDIQKLFECTCERYHNALDASLDFCTENSTLLVVE